MLSFADKNGEVLLLLQPEHFAAFHTTEEMFVQPEKADCSILVTLSGMVMEVRPEQLEKAEFPIVFTLSGMVIEVRLEQFWKARSPILVTLLGMVIEVRPEQL